MRGRKPTTFAHKLVTGNRGKRRLATIVPEPPEGAIPIPDTVSRNPRALGYWQHYVTNSSNDHLRPLDAPMLGLLCIAHAIMDQALDELRDATGKPVLTRTTATGAQATGVLVTIAERQARIISRLAGDLCLSVANRNRSGHYVPQQGPRTPDGRFHDDGDAFDPESFYDA